MSEMEKKFEEFRAKYHENRMARGLFYHKDSAKEYLDQQDRFMKIGFEAGYEEATAFLANQIWCQITPLQAKLAEQKSDYDKLEVRCKELQQWFDWQKCGSHFNLLVQVTEENRRLKAQLEKCKEQRNIEINTGLLLIEWKFKNEEERLKEYAKECTYYDKELDSITIDSIKRGENG